MMTLKGAYTTLECSLFLGIAVVNVLESIN